MGTGSSLRGSNPEPPIRKQSCHGRPQLAFSGAYQFFSPEICPDFLTSGNIWAFLVKAGVEGAANTYRGLKNLALKG